MKILLTILFFLSMLIPVMAADQETLWTTGKIHAVLGVLLTILVLIFAFLFILERKINRLEKRI